MTTWTPTDDWKRFAQRCRRAAGATLGAAGLMVGLVRATRRWDGWDALDPWTVWIPLALAGLGVCGALLALWAWAMRPERRWTRRTATAGVLGMVPAAYGGQWADRHPGYGALEILAMVVMSVGIVVVLAVAVGVFGRTLVALVDRRRRSRGRPMLDEAATAWLRSQRRQQQLAVLLIAAGATCLLVATFIPPSVERHGGAMGAFLELLARLWVVANDLAVGLVAGGIVLWLQEHRRWRGVLEGSDREPRARRPKGSRRSPHGPRRRWSSAP